MNDLTPCPNLIIMGAQKSGTTSLHEYLKVHPDIFMSSPIKEPGLFLGEERARTFWNTAGQPIASLHELLHERMLQGYQGERWFGDGSTHYTIGQRSRAWDIPQRMQAANPDMRFIYILRNPVERILSNYHHSRSKGRCQGTLTDFLASKEGPGSILTSRYWYQLEAYLELFPANQFHVVVFEEFIRQPHHHMHQVWDFLELSPPQTPPNFATHNAGSAARTKVSESDDDLSRILGVLRKDVENLQRWLGRDIPDWSNLSFATARN
ncbi:hypothetical protein ATO7_15252 [Oceanococcus atlanticus]|uniref:Sulfotransferase domain-containing protein n=1 Tax=Oceanococcus atlanticus TaxID=1317117 RepID=A0A1Y1SAR5_9GAMM|nr:sulfotransferase [Oceanococcus atlanticus]ORE85152.1 hypothetical protein ATO7_15252 [Oceanococcus atlanticus]